MKCLHNSKMSPVIQISVLNKNLITQKASIDVLLHLSAKASDTATLKVGVMANPSVQNSILVMSLNKKIRHVRIMFIVKEKESVLRVNV